MKSCLKFFSIISAFFSIILLPVSPAFAAAPDGMGPWADTVVASNQTNTKGGQPVSVVAPLRSNPSAALGVAENDTVEGHFFSLGFGGSISLGFDNGISSGVIIVEATNPGYPTETAKVEVSENGTTWVLAGNVSQDGQVNKPAEITCAKYVRITDTSNPADFSEPTADAYDVDGVQAQGDPCTPPVIGGGTCTCGNVAINQKNVNVVSTTVVSNANTGKNKVKNNVGGSNVVVTGNANSNVHVTTTGSSNSATTQPCCCSGKSTTAVITGNGNGSTNTINIGSVKKKAPKGSS